MFELTCFTIGILFLLGSVDDLIIDAVHAFHRLRPQKIPKEQWNAWRAFPEKPIAIMIPAWKESAVLEAMVKTNLARIRYQNYKWYIGVYPNDPETLSVAKDLQRRHPSRIVVVVTDRPGPTSKAHCLNCIMSVLHDEDSISDLKWSPHWVAIHDAEDVIHPDAFTAINAQPSDRDFIQLPIFSLPVPASEWVSGTYLDEFAEIHLREIPVRKILHMPIPSAGVGTFFSAPLLMKLGDKFGYWFDEENLTEDYEISLRIARLGGRQDFLLLLDEGLEPVATREYFPRELGRSIRQKTRWTTGIGLQTMAKWGSYGSFSRDFFKHRNWLTAYAVFRDRKALWANPTVMFALFMILVFAFLMVDSRHFFLIHHRESLLALASINTGLFTFRFFQRARFCTRIYGKKQGVLSIPRVMISTYINGVACIRALHQYFFARARNRQNKIEWDKTDHRFPTIPTEQRTS